MRKLVLGVGALAVLTACDDTLFNTSHDSGSGGEGYCGVQALMEAECGTCHGSGSPSAGLDLVSDLAGSTIDVTGTYGHVLVVPGDSSASFLYTKMSDEGVTDGGIMPPGSTLLDADKLAIVSDWIDSGASTECAEGDTDTDTDADSDTDADTDTDTDTDVGWCNTKALFETEGCTGCHDSGAAGWAWVDLQTDPYTALVMEPAQGTEGAILVVPGYPDASLLYRKVNHSLGESEGDVMPPPDAPQLDQAHIDTIHDWIAAGAGHEDCD